MVYVSEKAHPQLIEYLKASGHTAELIPEDPRLGHGVGAHADLRICKLGAYPDSSAVFSSENEFSPDYPQNAAYCAVCLDKYIIHLRSATAPAVKAAAETLGLIPINVRQGYTRCSCVIVDGRSLITADDGIYNALSHFSDISVLKVSPGYVNLPGFNEGFLGGASGRVGNEIVFNGDLSRHPDFASISYFIISRGLSLKYFSDFPLTDIGSVIEIK